MPQVTGNVPPPDGHGRSASDEDITIVPQARKSAPVPDDAATPIPGSLPPSAVDLDQTIVPVANADQTILPGQAPDVTMLPTERAAIDADATMLPAAGSPAQEINDVTRLVPVRPARPATERRTSTPVRSATPAPGTNPPGAARSASDVDEGPLVVGQAFGPRYHITRVLGVGGMGAVYQAWDAELGVDVAVKVIRPEIAADPETASEIERRFKRELLLARQVTHPNIIRIHDLGDIDGIKYITMPFIDGEDLATILRREQKLNVTRALRIARGTVSGLVSAHKAGVIHRDLKPANLMIGSGDTPTIMDFGIARSADGPGPGPASSGVTIRPQDLSRTAAAAASSTMAGAIVGTVAYMAPEQARGEAVDQRADIYAFGLILYDMLVGGRRAERAPSAIAELQQRMQTAPAPPRSIDPTIPEAVDAIIRRCLEPDLTKRFQTTVELQHAIERLDQNGAPVPIMKRVSRRTLVAASVAVVLLLAGTFYVTRWMSAPVVQPDPVSVLIADFQNNTGDPAFDHTITQTVRRALESASFISAYDRSRIRQMFSVTPPERFDVTAARELAIRQGLGILLAGSVDVRGSGYEISVQATHPMTGETIATIKRRASDRDQILDTAATVASGLRSALGDEMSESDKLLAMKSLTTTSFDVARYYAAAVDAQSRGKVQEAQEYYAKTVELDREFGLGYQGLSSQMRNLGRLEDAEKYASEALKYLDKMTERERLQIRAQYYLRFGDYPQCAQEYGELIARFPGDVSSRNQRAVCLAQLRDYRGAVEEMRQVMTIMPSHLVYRTNLAVFLNYSGQFAEAEQEIRKLPELSWRATGVLATSQIGQGLIAEAGESYKKMGQMDRFGASIAATGLADLAVYQGRFSEAISLFERGVEQDLAAKNLERAAMKLTSAAHAHLARGQAGPAVEAAEKALKHSTVAPVRLLAGRIFIEAGEVDRAKELIAGFASESAAQRQAYGKILEGGLALKTGDPQRAIKLLEEANALMNTWLAHYDLGRAYLEMGSMLKADSEFDRCIQRQGEALAVVDEDPTAGHFPIVYYYQGRVREALKTAHFADSYRKYLEIRGQSTEDPLVREVRKRLGN